MPGQVERAPPRARAVLWDLDGTLVDSAKEHWESWQRALQAADASVTYEQFRGTFGMRNDAILSRWLGPSVTPADIRRIGDAKEVIYRDLVAGGGLTPLPGAREWVTRLSERGWRQAVASSAPRANVEAVVQALGLGTYFDTLVAGEDVIQGKPDPAVFLNAARRLQVPAARCVVVEDARAGVEAAHRAGMKCIGVGARGFAPADLLVASLAELPGDAFDGLLVAPRT